MRTRSWYCDWQSRLPAHLRRFPTTSFHCFELDSPKVSWLSSPQQSLGKTIERDSIGLLLWRRRVFQKGIFVPCLSDDQHATNIRSRISEGAYCSGLRGCRYRGEGPSALRRLPEARHRDARALWPKISCARRESGNARRDMETVTVQGQIGADKNQRRAQS